MQKEKEIQDQEKVVEVGEEKEEDGDEEEERVCRQEKAPDGRSQVAKYEFIHFTPPSMNDDYRWTLRILEWRPRKTTRSIGKPHKSSVEYIITVAGKQRMRLVKDEDRWKY